MFCDCLCCLEIFMARKFSMGVLGVKFWSGDFFGFWFLPPFNRRCHLKSGVPPGVIGTVTLTWDRARSLLKSMCKILPPHCINHSGEHGFINKLFKRLCTRETTRWLKRTDKIPYISNKIKIRSLKSTGSAKRRFKTERIKLTLSGMAMRNKRCMFKNINVCRAKEAFVHLVKE